MVPGSPQKPAPKAGEQHRFLKAARQVSESIGAEFFSMLVNELRATLDAECVYVGEFVGARSERVRTMAAAVKDDRMDLSEFPLVDSPDAEVAMGTPCIYARGLRESFPRARLLGDLSIESCVAIPLNSPEGQACGVIAALFSEPLDLEIHFVQSMLNLFGPRAAAELNRKRADEALRESEQRYRAFVQLNPDACWRVEFGEPIETTTSAQEQMTKILRYGRIAECNDALVQRLGMERPDDLIGEPITDAVLDMQNAYKCLEALIGSGYHQSTIEVTASCRGRRSHFIHSHWGVVEKGKLVRIWGSSRDVTDLRELEVQFRHAQRLESIGRLAAGVAHDFNNLLSIIWGNVSEMLARTESSDRAYIGLSEIRKAAEKGAALSSQLLTFSRRQQSNEPQRLDLNSLVAEDERMLLRLLGKGIELTTELAPAPALVRANAGYIHQVLMNLVVNARDAMPGGGRLVISVSNVDIGERPPPHLAALEPGQYVRMRVADNGMGMAPDVEAHLFEPFFTTKQAAQGTGLGLSTVYGIVKQSGGHIIVQTELNKGTTFEIFFPRDVSN
jgi:signal transduction histidine kinase